MHHRFAWHSQWNAVTDVGNADEFTGGTAGPEGFGHIRGLRLEQQYSGPGHIRRSNRNQYPAFAFEVVLPLAPIVVPFLMSCDPSFVLVVEDEGLIRLSLIDELTDAGFNVLEAGNADEALRLLETHPEIDALFTDIDMPGSMDGLKLATLVHQSRPEIAILLTSGYLKIPKNDLPSSVPFLAKPYEIDRVVNHIRAAVPR